MREITNTTSILSGDLPQAEVNGLKVRPVSLSSMAMLELLNNSCLTQLNRRREGPLSEDGAEPAENPPEKMSMYALAEFVWIHAAPEEDVVRLVAGGGFDDPPGRPGLCRKSGVWRAGGNCGGHDARNERDHVCPGGGDQGSGRGALKKLAEPDGWAGLIMIMARATGWTEYYIKHMPLKILLQYVHAWLVQEGNATRWAYADRAKQRAMRSRIAEIIEQDNSFLDTYGD